jgi:microsomal epoxide hydrolase
LQGNPHLTTPNRRAKTHSPTCLSRQINRFVVLHGRLANIALYWFTGAIGSSFWPYYARMHGPWPVAEGQTVGVPVGYAQFPKEILRPPRSLAAKTYTDIRRWSVMPKGGHFAALEQPEALAREVGEFFQILGAA